MKTKKLMAAVAVALTLCVTIGGTLAWLTDTTDEVKNTFTVGKVDIALEETTENYKMIPGESIRKDPVVTVKSDSEDCWLFVKVVESKNLDKFIDYSVYEDEWKALESVEGVFYREVSASDTDQKFSVLTGDVVSVKENVTNDDMNEIENGNEPTLTFTAYAIQKAGFDTAAEAWAEVSK